MEKERFKKFTVIILSMTEEKVFAIKFLVRDGKMVTKMTSKNMTPQETIGSLEIAKQQILDGLKENKKDVFQGCRDD